MQGGASSKTGSRPTYCPRGWGSHTHFVPTYKGLKKSLVMLTAYQVMATIPQQPRGGRELH